ncbi:MAG TPA: carboxypeptidase-like regulatory domain-containing protein [Bryobacteraceae bacterium]|nr:carboxypeptidase-like regulatory domain-containing protein [Bryobacteraceae bacterium]
MRLINVLILVCLLALSAAAQTNLGTITGTITDPAGAVVPNAPIEAKNTATGAVYPVASSATGNYTISQLPLGTYELTVTVMGFKKYTRTGITVEAYGIYRIDPVLEVGATTESVVVEAAAPLLKTESTEVSYNIPTSTLDDLPILTLSGAPPGFFNSSGLGNIRNPLAALQLMPGTDFSTDNTLRVNGMPSSSQTINVEGQDASNGFWKQLTQANQQGADAIQEVTVQTSNYAAEYGQAGGGYINYTMKSGTNQVHGSGFDYFTNTVLNAGLPFTIDPVNPNYNTRNAIHQNDYGFTLGGPIVIPKLYNGHDRSFFFFSFEQFRQNNFTTTGFTQVPTQAERNGDFSGLFDSGLAGFTIGCNTVAAVNQTICPNQIFDPTTRTTVNGIPTTSPFTGNAVPKSMMDPTALLMQNYFPAPNNNSPVFNYTIPGYGDFRHTTIPSIKIDELISSKIKISGYYSATKTFSPQTNGFAAPITTSAVQDTLAQTIRLNLDDSVTPTFLLHLGAGLLHTTNPQVTPSFNQASAGLFPQGSPFPGNYFPYISGLSTAAFLFPGFFGAGSFPTGNTASFFEAPFQEDVKPTFNANATWIKGNHTFKLGATAMFEGIPSVLAGRANGEFEFSNIETADPAQYGQPWASYASSGLGYASFLLGRADGLQLAPSQTGVRLGMHSYGIYVQDSWKVTHTLTVELGLRWDYANLWTEEHGRLQNAAFTVPNPTLGGRLGSVIYEKTCHCSFAQPYGLSIGPHLGVAWQITPKTVFRAGGAINYGAGPDQAGLNASVADFLALTAPGYGLPAAILKNGDPYAPGNVLNNPVLTYDNFYNPQTPQYPPATSGLVPPSSPFVSIANNAARLPRIFQWSIGFQRELSKDMVIEAAYVGNRGAWWTAPLLSSLNYNGLSVNTLQSRYGLNVKNPTDAALLLTPISSPQVTARFPNLANPNNVYPGFPGTEPLIAALVPEPQWYNGIPPFLGPPLGDTWYDSLQIKFTKRFSHGLNAQVAYTWQKELTNGVNSNTSYLTPQDPIINDVYNSSTWKQLSGFDIPQELIIAFSYTTPKWETTMKGGKAFSWALRDWTLSGLFRYQSGLLIRTPPSNSPLLTELGIGTANNPALWGGGTTLYTRNPGVPLFLVDPNSHFDPTKQLVLNPAAWTDTAAQNPGTYGYSAPYYNDFRWQRKPAESLGFGRIFRIKEHMQFQIRAEFQNIFNRLFYSTPSDGVGIFGLPSTNPATSAANGGSITGANGLVNEQGLLSAGYGFVAFQGGAGAMPRSGQLIARITF